MSAFLDGGPGCEDIIDEENGFFCYRLLLVDGECPVDILLSLEPRKFSLGLGRANAPQGGVIQGNGMLAGDLPGKEEGLIVSPLSKTSGVEGDGNNEAVVMKRKICIGIICQKMTQRYRQTGGAPIFKPGN